MKKLLFLLVFGLLLTSCDNTPILKKIDNPKEITTVELKEKATQDTITYKVIENKDNSLYLIDKDTNLISYKVINTTGEVETFLLIIIILLITTFLILALN